MRRRKNYGLSHPSLVKANIQNTKSPSLSLSLSRRSCGLKRRSGNKLLPWLGFAPEQCRERVIPRVTSDQNVCTCWCKVVKGRQEGILICVQGWQCPVEIRLGARCKEHQMFLIEHRTHRTLSRRASLHRSVVYERRIILVNNIYEWVLEVIISSTYNAL